MDDVAGNIRQATPPASQPMRQSNSARALENGSARMACSRSAGFTFSMERRAYRSGVRPRSRASQVMLERHVMPFDSSNARVINVEDGVAGIHYLPGEGAGPGR